MKRYRIAIVTIGGLLAAHLLLRAVEAPAPSPSAVHSPGGLKAPAARPAASAVPRVVATPAPASVTTPPLAEPAPAARSAEPDAPADKVSERMLIAGDTIAGQCAREIMWNANRFSNLLQALRREVAGDAGVEAQRRAITEAYREAFAVSGSGAQLIDAACGAHLCAVEIRLPVDTADDEIRDAMVGRLLNGIEVVSTQVSVNAIDGASRETRRIFSMSPEVWRLGPRPCAE